MNKETENKADAQNENAEAGDSLYDKKDDATTPEVTDEKPADENSGAKEGDEGEAKEGDEKKGDDGKAAAKEKVSDSGKEGDGKAPAKDAGKETIDLKLPEGVQVDAAQLEAVKEFAKANGLTQVQAQAILDRDIKSEADHRQRQSEANAEVVKGWIDEIKKDKELGGKNFKSSVDRAHRFFKQFAPDMVEELEKTQLGNHPGLIKIANRVMREFDDDSFVDAPRSRATQEAEREEDIMYPKTKASQG